MKNISKAQWYMTWDLIFVPWLPVMGIFWILGIRHSELLQIMFQGLTRTHASREIFLWGVSLLTMAFCSNVDFKTKELILGWFFNLWFGGLGLCLCTDFIPSQTCNSLPVFFFLEGKTPEAPAPSKPKINKQRKSLCYDAVTKLSRRRVPSTQNVIIVFRSWKKCQAKQWTDRSGPSGSIII